MKRLFVYPESHFVVSTLMCAVGFFLVWNGAFAGEGQGVWREALVISGGMFYLFREAFQYIRGTLGCGYWGRIATFILGHPNPRFDWIGLWYGFIPGLLANIAWHFLGW